jgi:hypothetical protein
MIEYGVSAILITMLLLLRSINSTCLSILKVLRLKKPGKVSITMFEGEGMLSFVLTLPERSAKDVVARELTVSVDGVETVESLNGDSVESQVYSGLDNAAVAGRLVDIDDAGNRSEPSEFTFVLVDTIAPPAPGQVGLKVTAED